jgi:hypothetical protein
MNNDGKQRARDLPDDALISDGGLHLVVVTGGIVITMPGTDFLVAYRMVKGTPGLVVAKVHGDPPCQRQSGRVPGAGLERGQ